MRRRRRGLSVLVLRVQWFCSTFECNDVARLHMTATKSKRHSRKDPFCGKRSRITMNSSEGSAGVICPDCGVFVRLLLADFDDWSVEKNVKCDVCDKQFDLYSEALKRLAPDKLLQLAGARLTEYMMPVSEGLTLLSFDKLKIPQDAKILDRHFEGVRDPEKPFKRLDKNSPLTYQERQKLLAPPLKLLLRGNQRMTMPQKQRAN